MITGTVEIFIKNRVFTSEQKTIDTGAHITGFALGSNEFYRWAANYAKMQFRPLSYTHDIRVLAALENFYQLTQLYK